MTFSIVNDVNSWMIRLRNGSHKAGKLLYSLGAPGENDGTHDATEKVFGRDRFYVRAQVKGDGMFLVSDSNDHGVFAVTGKAKDKFGWLTKVPVAVAAG